MYNVGMYSAEYEQEKEIQFESDKAAFSGLSPRKQWWASKTAQAGFQARWFLTGASRALIGALEVIINIGLRLPYVFLWRGIRAASNGIVKGAKWTVHGGTYLAQAVLGLSKKSKKIEGWKKRLPQWEQETIEKIDTAWKNTKKKLKEIKHKTEEFAEYYGALGLYRGTKWLLNPRTSSGSPLLGNEVLNKTIGTIMAGAAFIFLSFQLSKIAVMGKVWHVTFAKSFAADTAPLAIKMLKQVAFHPLLTAGVTALKFLTLPAIAATRQALKSTPFAQGIAYEYNCHLREKNIRKQEKRAAREQNPSHSKIIRILSRYMNKKSLSFLGRFIVHIVEKAAPEHYESRIKYYTVPQPERATTHQPKLTPAFAKHQKPENAPAKAPKLQPQDPIPPGQ